MKITAFNGSPRGQKSATNIMVEEFLAGAREAGAETESVLLSEKEIKHCVGCFSCWIKTPGVCAIDDDMKGLIEQYLGSDIAIFATPVYIGLTTGIMKDFLDRLIPIIDPHFVIDENGAMHHPMRYENYPKLVVISNCGFAGMDQFELLKLLFRGFAPGMNSELIGEIYRDMGPLLSVKDPRLDPIVESYKTLLRKAGMEIVRDMKLSDETIAELEKPMIPAEMYMQAGNESWDRYLSASED